MSILNVNQIQPVGSGQTVTISATNISAGSATVTAGTFSGGVTVTSGNLTGITSVSTSNLTVNGNAYPSAGPLSNRNMVINGSMVVNQRGYTGAAGTTTGYSVDRFSHGGSNDAVISVGQTSMNSTTGGDAYADGFKNALYLEVTTADASLTGSQWHYITHTLEGHNVQSIKKGTVNAQPLTLSFWIRSNTTGTYVCELYDSDNTRTCSQSYTIDSANTWEKKVLTYPADTTGVFNDDNGGSLSIAFWTGVSSYWSSGTLATTWEARTDANRAVGQTNLLATVGNNLWLTGVQLEVGSVATPFEHRSYGDELLRCQRYYCQSVPGSRTASSMTNEMLFGRGESYLSWTYPVIMRAVPSVVTSNDTGTGVGYYTVSSVNNYTNGTVLRNGVNQYALLTPSSNASYNTKTGYNADAEF